MESQPQNPEFRFNPENFHPCIFQGLVVIFHQFSRQMQLSRKPSKFRHVSSLGCTPKITCLLNDLPKSE